MTMNSRIFCFLTCVRYETVADNRHAGLHSATFVYGPSSKQEIKDDIHQTQDHKTSPKMLNDCSKLVVRRNCKIKGRDYGTLNEFLRETVLTYISVYGWTIFTAFSRTIQMTTLVESFWNYCEKISQPRQPTFSSPCCFNFMSF